MDVARGLGLTRGLAALRDLATPETLRALTAGPDPAEPGLPAAEPATSREPAGPTGPGARRETGAVRRLGAFALGAGRATARFTRPAAASLNGPIGPHRRWYWQTVPLDEAKAVKRSLGGTVNDVVLAAVTAGYRDLLNARGVLTPDTVVRSAVPVSVREPGGRGVMDNRVAAVFVNLPVGVDDPLERLRRIRTQTDDVKRSEQAAGTRTLTRLTDAAVAPALLSLAARVPVRLRQGLVQTVTTNVPGPDFPLYVMGRRLLELHPYVPLTGGIRVATAVISYCGTLYFGITADFDAMPDLETYAKGASAGVAELLALA
ncbi:DUF1298 domain-containing protein [Actinomadura logoneensis]|uniref:diacylglycerol O-acyltransferase n=2 Tax=Actinomadura logoneensis TaxID=2293572 RepID=A0A372J8X2_9ACTN|nr:DUF1298 domain-containing protein [Actinomadura logoneensis]